MISLLVRYILSAAIKDRLFIRLLALVVVAVSLSIFLGSAALTEREQFSLVFASGGLRIGGLVTVVLFAVFYVRRSFETRDVEYLLSRPISKFQFLFSHFLSLSILTGLVALLISLALFFMPSGIDIYSLAMWGLSLWVEITIMVNVALFFSLMLPSAVTATLVTLAFYVLARLMGGVLGIIAAGGGDSSVISLLEKVMLVISIFIPRLDLMGQTSWLIYGFDGGQDITFILLQGLIFSGFIFSVALWDLTRKQF